MCLRDRVGAAPFAAALERASACAAAHGGFAAGTAEALGRTRWDRIVAASPLEQAGSDPAAYLGVLAELLVDDGMTEDQARTAALVAALALRSQLEEPARAAARALEQAGCDAPHPLACPVCGGAPVAGRVGGESSTQGRGKTLWCAQCGTSWEVERVRCARCGTQNQAHLHYYNVEGDDAHRIATCDECGGYLRTVYADNALAPFSFEVEDEMCIRDSAYAAPHDGQLVVEGQLAVLHARHQKRHQEYHHAGYVVETHGDAHPVFEQYAQPQIQHQEHPDGQKRLDVALLHELPLPSNQQPAYCSAMRRTCVPEPAHRRFAPPACFRLP